MYQEQLNGSGYGEITTEIAQAGPFYYAEDYHQQYLDKNPGRLLRQRRHGGQLPRRPARRLSSYFFGRTQNATRLGCDELPAASVAISVAR